MPTVLGYRTLNFKTLKSCDTETTGLDLYHGVKPYLATFCKLDEVPIYWEAYVNPYNREPVWSKQDLKEIQAEAKGSLVFQNPKYDVPAFKNIDIKLDWKLIWDTLMAGHLLASNHAHDLTSMALEFIDSNIKPYEDALEKATNEARRMARSKWPKWMIAKKGLPCMPSAREKVWKFDAWLPRLIARKLAYAKDHPWWTVLSDYACADSLTTIRLFKTQVELLKKLDLWEIYLERIKVLPIANEMEDYGVTLNVVRQKELDKEYSTEGKQAETRCVALAKKLKFDLSLPKGGRNKSLDEFAFKVLKLPVVKLTKAGKPSLDKKVLEHFTATLEEGIQLDFIRDLGGKRKRDTACSYMNGYKRFWLPVKVNPKTGAGWYVLHPNLNPTGTNTLRWSCSNPNEQNISKQHGDQWPELTRSLRYLFGPTPDREWWSVDYNNLELVIPAYESGEQAMIDLFERPNDAPYFGSYHLLIFDILHPDKFKEHGAKCKDVFKSTWYQWTKNGNFAVTYGAIEKSGTADAAYHVPGAQRRIKSRFGKLTELNQKMIDYANLNGYVETIPDKTVNPRRGYPLLCTRTNYNRILETVPLNYHVQGTAMWVTFKAMLRCDAYLKKISKELGYCCMVMQVHDEIVFSFPRGKTKEQHLPYVRELQRLMNECGDDIGIPLRTTATYHPSNWEEGVAA